MTDSALDELGTFDCVLFGDVLEHLMDPWQMLRRLRARMQPDARIAACIPNMQHWSIQARLSVGDLTYEDHGLLDRTHIRWFTRQTIAQLFASTGFVIEVGLSGPWMIQKAAGLCLMSGTWHLPPGRMQNRRQPMPWSINISCVPDRTDL